MNIKDVPEHQLSKAQVAELMNLLDPKFKLRQSPNVNAAARLEKELQEAAGGFMHTLVFGQNAPLPAEEIAKLKRIESAATQALDATDDVSLPYLRMMAGDILVGDHKVKDLIAAVEELKRIAELAVAHVQKLKKNAAEGRRERQQIAERRFRELDDKGDREGLKLARIRMTESRPKKPAMRVLIHRLGLAWLHARGEHPKVSVSPKTRKPGGEFIRFVQHFITAMREQTKEKHIKAAPNITHELKGATPNAIHSHVKAFNQQLMPSLRASMGEIVIKRGSKTIKKGGVTTHLMR